MAGGGGGAACIAVPFCICILLYIPKRRAHARRIWRRFFLGALVQQESLWDAFFFFSSFFGLTSHLAFIAPSLSFFGFIQLLLTSKLTSDGRIAEETEARVVRPSPSYAPQSKNDQHLVSSCIFRFFWLSSFTSAPHPSRQASLFLSQPGWRVIVSQP